jgi:Methyltransferase domain
MTTFTEDWFSEWSCEVLADLVRKVDDVPGMILEIGSWEGRSTIALANAAFPRHVHAVDTWAGSPGEISEELASGRDVHATFVANVAESTEGNVVEHRMGWREFVPTIEGDVALCFIDAEHTYREVRDNIMAILPFIPKGGIICGDDQHHPPIRQALAEIFDPAYVWVSASVWWWVKP